MLKAFFTSIFPVALLAILLVVASYMIVKGFYTGSISYGYKYYGSGNKCKRVDDPFGFWLGVVLYLAAIIAIIVFGYFIFC